MNFPLTCEWHTNFPDSFPSKWNVPNTWRFQYNFFFFNNKLVLSVKFDPNLPTGKCKVAFLQINHSRICSQSCRVSFSLCFFNCFLLNYCHLYSSKVYYLPLRQGPLIAGTQSESRPWPVWFNNWPEKRWEMGTCLRWRWRSFMGTALETFIHYTELQCHTGGPPNSV